MVDGLAKGKYKRDEQFPELIMENNANWNPHNKDKLQKKQGVDMVTEHFKTSAKNMWDLTLNPSKNEQDGELPIVSYPSSDEVCSPPEHERATNPTNPSARSDTTMEPAAAHHQNQDHSDNGQAGC